MQQIMIYAGIAPLLAFSLYRKGRRMIGEPRAHGALPGWMLPALAAGWALLAVLLIATARRYLRLFRQRPHPFLQR